MQRKRSSATSLLLIALLAGCTLESAQVAPVVRPEARQRCIALDQVAGRRVAGSSIIFETTDGTNYRNDFVGACPGLDRLGAAATVSVASGGEGGQLCSGDRVRVMDPVEAGVTGPLSQPTCILGEFRAEAR